MARRPPARAHSTFLRALGAFLVIGVSLAVSPVQATFAGTELVDAYWGTPGQRAEVSPGDVGRALTLEFRNNGDQGLASLEVDLRPPDGLTPTFTGADEAQRSQVLKPGEVWTPTFTFDLDPALEPGDVVKVPGKISMRETTDGSEAGPYKAMSFTAKITVTGTSRLTVHALEPSVRAHSQVPVPLNITNEGDTTARGLEIHVEPAAGSTLQVVHPAGAETLEELDPGNWTHFEAEVLTPEAPGQQSIVVTLSYVDAAGGRVVRAQTVPLSISEWPQGPLDVSLATPQLTAGRDDTVSFDVTNARGGTMEGVVATLTIDGGAVPPTIFPRSGSYQFPLGDLDPDQERTLDVLVTVASLAPETHAVELTFTWTGPQGLQHDWTYPFGVRVQGAIQLILSETCGSVDKTGRASASATVTNVGNQPALNAYAALHRDALGEHDRVELGDIDPNDPFRFELEGDADDLDADAIQRGEVEVMLFWNDERGTEVTEVHALPIHSDGDGCLRSASGGPPGNGAPGPAAATVLGVLAAAVVAWRRRR